jgi:hypothetical protein
MAYKFQVGEATLSGSTKFEEQLDAAGGIKLSGISDTAIAVASDSILFYDSDGSMKRDSVADLATAFAGDGLAASSGVLAVGVDNSTVELSSDAVRVKAAGINVSHLNSAVAGLGISGGGGSALALDFSELSDEAIASGDRFAFRDATDDGMHADTVDDLATLFAGDGLAASSAVMSVDLSGSGGLEISSNKLAIQLSSSGGLSMGSGLALDIGALDEGAVTVASDFFIFTAPGEAPKREAVADLMTAVAGSGLAVSSGVLSVGVDGTGIEINSDALRLKDSGVVTDKIADAAVTADKIANAVAGDGLSGGGGSALALDLNELTAAAVDVAADSIAIVDANDSNGSKKESIADLMTAVAGVGLAASAGVLNARLDVGLAADGDTLAAGMNYMADMSADGEDVLTLPASPSVGDVVHVKAPSDCSQARTVRIDRAGSQTIDGLNSVTIESPFGAVSMVYVASNLWRLI